MRKLVVLGALFARIYEGATTRASCSAHTRITACVHPTLPLRLFGIAVNCTFKSMSNPGIEPSYSCLIVKYRDISDSYASEDWCNCLLSYVRMYNWPRFRKHWYLLMTSLIPCGFKRHAENSNKHRQANRLEYGFVLAFKGKNWAHYRPYPTVVFCWAMREVGNGRSATRQLSEHFFGHPKDANWVQKKTSAVQACEIRTL